MAKDRKITELGKAITTLKTSRHTFLKMTNTISQSLTGGELPTDQIKLDWVWIVRECISCMMSTISSYDLEKYLGNRLTMIRQALFKMQSKPCTGVFVNSTVSALNTKHHR